MLTIFYVFIRIICSKFADIGKISYICGKK